MPEKKPLNRRSFMMQVTGALVLAGGATALVTGRAAAQPYSGRTDNDSGEGADRAGYGQSGNSFYSDNDPTDPTGQGRGGGYSDNDPSDPTGQGRGGGGYSDSDPTDPTGQGRNGTGVTDSDSGAYADRAGYGRGGHPDLEGGPGPYTGRNDNDPSDPSGYGRSGSGITDSDPSDTTGNGRGT